MPLITEGELTIEVAENGAGPPVVLLHSSVAGNRQWRKLSEALGGRFRVHAPNLYGYGQTSAWNAADGPQWLAAAVRPVLVLIDRLPAPVRLVGHSWGGTLALLAAARLRERVSQLVLFEPMLAGMLRELGRAAAWGEVEALYSDVKRLGAAGQWEALAERFTNYFNGDGAWRATPPDRRALVAGLLQPNFFEWDSAAEAVVPADFAAITARTLLMHSADTRPALREMTMALRAHFPHWAGHEVASGGHMAPLTRTDLVNPPIVAFLEN